MVTLVTPDDMVWTEAQEGAAWERIDHALTCSEGMVFDGCHKIYIMMDRESFDEMMVYGYDVAAPNGDTIRRWWDESCGLRFIQTIRHGGRLGDDFESLIPQLFTTGE